MIGFARALLALARQRARDVLEAVPRCPRRGESPGADARFPHADVWKVDRWAPRPDSPTEAQMRAEGRLIGPEGGVTWRWPWAPRTCSYCGGVNPEDAIRLIEEGWHNEGTSKGYKHYLEPAGGEWKPLVTGDDGLWYRPPWSPIPPVKVYTMHFDKDQIARINEALRAQPKGGVR